MSERGVFAVDRGIWDHPIFADEPFTEREAWQWLIGEASFRPRTRNIGGRVVQLERGQLAASVRFMAERFKWGKSSVDRFLKKLKTETMIGTDAGTGILIITICNYTKYQKVSLPSGTVSEAENGTAAGQQRDKREDTETIEVDSEAKASGALAPVYTDSRHELWGEGVPILVSLGVKPEKQARSVIGRWLKTNDPASVLSAIQRARDNRVMSPIEWITRALQPKNDHDRTHHDRSNSASRPSQSNADAIMAGMGRLAERLFADEPPAGGGSLPGRSDTPGGDDAIGRPSRRDPEAFGQLRLVAVANAR